MAIRLNQRNTAMTAGLLALAGLSGCGSASSEKIAKADAKPRSIPVTVAPIALKTVERTVEAVGSLKGFEEVVVGAKREGRVLKVFHDMGDRVKPGQALVALETTDADLAVLQAQRRLQVELSKLGLKTMPGADFDIKTIPSVIRAKVALVRTQTNLTRERTLSARKAGALQDFQNAENDEQGAEAALADAVLIAESNLASAQVAKVALDMARQSRADMEITVPLPTSKSGDGIYAVSKRQVSEGQWLKQGDPMFEIVIEKPLKLWTSVPERHTPEIKLGQEVRVGIASYPKKRFVGTVSRINPSIDPVSRTFQVESEIPNDEGLLRPGGFAKASILIDSKAEAIVVPLESVVKFAGGTKVFMLEGKKSKAVNVETGLEGPGWIEVIGNVPKTGDVVITGQTQLAEGTDVDVIVRDPAVDLKPVPKEETETKAVKTGA